MTPTQLMNLRRTGEKPAESVCVYAYPFPAIRHLEPFLYPRPDDDLRGLMGLDVVVVFRNHCRKRAAALTEAIEIVLPKSLHMKNMDTFQVVRRV